MDLFVPPFSSLAWWPFFVINGISFLSMLWDKAQSKKSGAERISEGVLFFLAIMFGSMGVYLGMLLFRHKTRKWYFMMGVPLLILENITFLLVLVQFLRGEM